MAEINTTDILESARWLRDYCCSNNGCNECVLQGVGCAVDRPEFWTLPPDFALPPLLPCPFCGGRAEALLSSSSYGSEAHKTYTIRCAKCGVLQCSSVTVKYGYDVYRGAWADETDLKLAIEKWNMRCESENNCSKNDN